MGKKEESAYSSRSIKRGINNARRSQASMEYLMVAGLAFVIIIPMIYLLYSYTSDVSFEVTQSKLGKIGTDMANTAEQIFYLGEPSRTTLRFDMPEGVYDFEVTGDNTLVFKTGDPSNTKEVTTFSNVNIISYLLPEDIAQGRHNYKLEAEKNYVALYTGDKKTAMLKFQAYQVFRALMAGAELMYSSEPLVGKSGNTYTISTKDNGDLAYVYSAAPSPIDVFADVTMGTAPSGAIHFFVGSVGINEITQELEVSRSLDISMNADNKFIFYYGGTNKLDTRLSDGTLGDFSFVIDTPYELKIKRVPVSECPTNSDTCTGSLSDSYYLFTISEGPVLKAYSYVTEEAISGNYPLDQFVFGDVSETQGITVASLSNMNLASASTYEKKSSQITKNVPIILSLSMLNITGNSVFFNITTQDSDGNSIGIPISFNSYYPLTPMPADAGSIPAGQSCEFAFTMSASTINIVKGGCNTIAP